MNEVQQKPASGSFFGRGAGKPIFAKNGFPAHKNTKPKSSFHQTHIYLILDFLALFVVRACYGIQ